MAKMEIRGRPEQELRERVARAVAGVDRLKAGQAREKANAEERTEAKDKALLPSKRSWWLLAR
jgi:hypothetical protein